MQDRRKAVWSIPYVSVISFFPSLKQNFIAYRSSKVSDCIFEIHQLWQSGFSRVYSNCCCSCSFEPGIIKIGQSSHKMYSNNILNFQESTTILNACTKKSGNLLKAPLIYISRVYSNCYCSCSFEPEIIKIGQSSHKMYSNNIGFSRVYDNFKCLYKKVWKLIEGPTHTHIYIYILDIYDFKCNFWHITPFSRMTKSVSLPKITWFLLRHSHWMGHCIDAISQDLSNLSRILSRHSFFGPIRDTLSRISVNLKYVL